MDPTVAVAVIAAGSALLGSAVGSLAPVLQAVIASRHERTSKDSDARDKAEAAFVEQVTMFADGTGGWTYDDRQRLRFAAIRLRPYLRRGSAYYDLVEKAYDTPQLVSPGDLWSAIDADAPN